MNQQSSMFDDSSSRYQQGLFQLQNDVASDSGNFDSEWYRNKMDGRRGNGSMQSGRGGSGYGELKIYLIDC